MTPNRRTWPMAAMIVALATGIVMYRWLVHHRLEQTAALFIGLPAVLAVALLLTARPRSATGVIMLVITIFLLISAMFLGEGFICVLMASPIAYAVGLVIGLIGEWCVKKWRARNAVLMIMPFAAMSLEGVNGHLSFSRGETVTVERVVGASAASVEQALARAPRFARPLPGFLRLGFPRPGAAVGWGLHPGDERRIRFAGGEGSPGDLVARLVEHDRGHVRFALTGDSSHIAHWLVWQQAGVDWQALDSTHTRVRWTLSYRRLLDPAWYFGPWERYAVRLSAGYLIETLATP